MEGVYDMGNAMPSDPQRQRQLPVYGVRLNQAFNSFLDMETFEGGVAPRPVKPPNWNHVPTMSMDDGPKLVEALMTERQVQAFDDTLGMNLCTTSSWPRQVKSPRYEQMGEDSGLGNTNWQGQSPGRCTPRDEQELACRAADVEPGSQTLGVAVNSVALQLPLIKHPSYNQSAMASGCYPRDVLTEESAGTNLMVAPKVAYGIMCCGI